MALISLSNKDISFIDLSFGYRYVAARILTRLFVSCNQFGIILVILIGTRLPHDLHTGLLHHRQKRIVHTRFFTRFLVPSTSCGGSACRSF
jgi:hypothetical protein